MRKHNLKSDFICGRKIMNTNRDIISRTAVISKSKHLYEYIKMKNCKIIIYE